MKIAPFAVEEWMNANENDARFNIAETCVDSISLDELFAITGTDRQAFFDALAARRLTYGAITGDETFKAGVCRLYKTVHPGEVIPTHGAAGANHHLFYSLLEPGDHVISVMPTYQQLYDIPRSFGAEVS
ncbi:MAG: aminotransferase class I/II-fold pyridoxal phosphate-dependent enzyme, partial [Clostridia bacterium]|nr:aminotransferase class I/II-fold pyridoxal phosphate-dependent enzyme [Clostridia bacterium]